jgi:glycosyltransferase involved in cell wall biosynthesis
MNSINFSVIIPVFNGASFISDSINSVLNQTIDDFEIIVIDDKSTDSTIKELEKFGNQITLITNSQNSGASFSRNQGIKTARGEYIAFLDADDLWIPEKLSSQLAVLKKHPEAGLLFSNCKLVAFEDYKPECLIIEQDLTKFELIDFSEVFSNPYFHTSTIIAKRSLCLEIGCFREDLITAEDIDFCLKLAKKTTTIKMFSVLTIPRRRANSLGCLPQSYQDNLLVIKDFVQNEKEFYNENNDLVKAIQKKIHDDWLCDLIYNRELKKAMNIGLKSLYLKPTVKTTILLMKAILLSFATKIKTLS